jgi:hypothetical protein
VTQWWRRSDSVVEKKWLHALEKRWFNGREERLNGKE